MAPGLERIVPESHRDSPRIAQGFLQDYRGFPRMPQDGIRIVPGCKKNLGSRGIAKDSTQIFLGCSLDGPGFLRVVPELHQDRPRVV